MDRSKRLAGVVCLSMSGAFSTIFPSLADGPLPFPDGRYVTDPSICTLDETQMVDLYTDKLGRYVRLIEGSSLEDGYEMDCEVSNVRRSGSDISFKATCSSEGMREVIDGRYVAIGSEAFALSGSVFRRCGTTSAAVATESADFFDATTVEIINLWHEANSQCRGGAGNDPRTMGACGSREEYSAILDGRNWCYGRDGEAGYQMEWHQCGPTSTR